ncbi:hypothetical protein GCM10009603_67540 [Nocardiopsis exhalans]
MGFTALTVGRPQGSVNEAARRVAKCVRRRRRGTGADGERTHPALFGCALHDHSLRLIYHSHN